MVPIHEYSTTWNVRLLNFRVRKGIGCNQPAMTVQTIGNKIPFIKILVIGYRPFINEKTFPSTIVNRGKL